MIYPRGCGIYPRWCGVRYCEGTEGRAVYLSLRTCRTISLCTVVGNPHLVRTGHDLSDLSAADDLQVDDLVPRLPL